MQLKLPMLDDLLRRLRSALMRVPPEQARRYASIDAWVAGLSREEARRLAREVLENPAWFRTEPGDASGSLPAEVPPTVKALYSRYVSAIGVFSDMQLVDEWCDMIAGCAFGACSMPGMVPPLVGLKAPTNDPSVR